MCARACICINNIFVNNVSEAASIPLYFEMPNSLIPHPHPHPCFLDVESEESQSSRCAWVI